MFDLDRWQEEMMWQKSNEWGRTKWQAAIGPRGNEVSGTLAQMRTKCDAVACMVLTWGWRWTRKPGSE